MLICDEARLGGAKLSLRRRVSAMRQRVAAIRRVLASRIRRLSLARRARAVASVVKRQSLPRRGKAAAYRAASLIKRLSLPRRGRKAVSLIRRMSLPRRGRELVQQMASVARRASIPRRARSAALRGLILGWSYVPASMREAVEDLVAGITSLIVTLRPAFSAIHWSIHKLALFIRLLLHAAAKIPTLLASLSAKATVPHPRVAGAGTKSGGTLLFSEWLRKAHLRVLTTMSNAIANKMWPYVKSISFGAAATNTAFVAAMMVVKHHQSLLIAVASVLLILYMLPIFVEYVAGRVVRNTVSKTLATATKQLDVALKQYSSLNVDLNASPWPLIRHHLSLFKTFI
jgi:hypothetical protein